MKKNILICTCVFTTFTHAMETVSSIEKTNNSLSITYNGTQVNFIKGSLYCSDKPVNITVISENQQRKLKGHGSPGIVGSVHCYHPYPDPIHKEIPCDKHSIIIRIEEPCITTDERGFIYNVRTEDTKQKTWYYTETLEGFIAIQKALSDLILCYNNCLHKGLTLNCPQKTIALPILGTNFGFPQDIAEQIAIETTFDFIQRNPQRYKSINFLVKEYSDVISQQLKKYDK